MTIATKMQLMDVKPTYTLITTIAHPATTNAVWKMPIPIVSRDHASSQVASKVLAIVMVSRPMVVKKTCRMMTTTVDPAIKLALWQMPFPNVLMDHVSSLVA
eukprot:CAMPEP_0195263408 /NCGR_PEP_ID=MMETSP0706-20130129/10293_1 /TAXON_ID=33640 /ORGANISM="Asterionellopsis glacialis, Strain CCMP134" /LENGTH=101 /DNA_ID=CAMNT_0040317595 /DNA_START=87 /DNA_END=392 /DNA_ORIENTATION=-